MEYFQIFKELKAHKSCIFDIEWLSSNHLACGGADNFVIVYDVETKQKMFQLKEHTSSVKSIASIPYDPNFLASASRDGSVYLFDLRCNRSEKSSDGAYVIRPTHRLEKAHFFIERVALKSRNSNLFNKNNSQQLTESPVGCVAFQNENILVSAGSTDGFIKVCN